MKYYLRLRKIFAFLVLVLLPIVGYSANEMGEPLLQNYDPTDYGSHGQIWSIIQDKRGVMYFGTTNGITEFDGTNWRHLEISNHSTIRSLAMDPEGRIYFGAVSDLGMLGCDNKGSLNYHSLKVKIPEKHRNFADVWRTLITSHGIYFVLQDKIFRWHQGGFEIVFDDPTLFLWSCRLDDTVYVFSRNLDRNYGEVLVLINGKIRPLPHCRISLSEYGPTLKVLPYPGNKLLICSRQKLFLYDLDKLSLPRLFKEENYAAGIPKSIINPIHTKFDEYLKHNELFTCLRITDYRYAIGTMKGGIIITDFKKNDFYIINKERGLQDDCIWSLYLDKSQNLWVGTNFGISYIELSSQLTKFSK